MTQLGTHLGVVHMWRHDEPAFSRDRSASIMPVGRSIQLWNASPYGREPRRSWSVAWPDAALAAALAEPQAATSSHAVRTSTLAVRIARDTCAIVAFDPAAAEDTGVELLRLPYALLPYVYSLLWDAAHYDAPLLRPLHYHFPDDAAAWRADGQLMLGAWMLAALPSARAGETPTIYVPAGRWYDWWSGAAIEGPLQFSLPCASDRMPLFARAGAVVPRGPELRLGDAQPLVLDLYPGNGALTLYEDGSYHFDPDQSHFCTTTYRVRADRERLQLTIGERAGTYTPRRRRIVLRVHAAAEHATCAGAMLEPAQQLLNLTLEDDGCARKFEFSLEEIRENVASPR